jgi:hypothetical protein
MRFKSSRVLVVLLAVFAMSAVAAASASAALPELVNKEGKALVKNKLTTEIEKGEGAVTFKETTANQFSVECGTAAVTGKFTGLKAGETTYTLTNCKGLGGKCTEAGKATGEMVFPFSLSLVYTSKASKELALLFTLHEGVSFACEGVKFTILGSFLVPIPGYDTNKLFATREYLRLEAKESGRGIQQVTKYENEKGEKVETYLEISQAGAENHQTSARFEADSLFEEGWEFKG